MDRSKSGAYQLSVLNLPAEWDDSRLRSSWAELTEKSQNINALYNSSVWFDLLRARHKPEDLAIAVARDASGALVGIAPILFKDHPFQYYVSRYPIITRHLKAAHVLGSVPMFPTDSQVYTQLVDALLTVNVDCVYMDTVPTDHPFTKSATATWKRTHLVYAPGGARPWHLRQIPSTCEEYLSLMSSKTKSTLRKKAKKLAQSLGGELEIVRVDRAHQVRDFLAQAVKVSRNSWQHQFLGSRLDDSDDERAWGERVAGAGLLRSYLLKAGERPCAFVVGYQFNCVYHYVELGYDRELSEHSPGTILLHMLIQDLCDHKRPATLNFGMGDGDYKRRFGNVQIEDVSIIILRKTLRNYFLIRSHALLRYLVSVLKGIKMKWKAKNAEGQTQSNKRLNIAVSALDR